jgi:hypothetical protein
MNEQYELEQLKRYFLGIRRSQRYSYRIEPLSISTWNDLRSQDLAHTTDSILEIDATEAAIIDLNHKLQRLEEYEQFFRSSSVGRQEYDKWRVWNALKY